MVTFFDSMNFAIPLIGVFVGGAMYGSAKKGEFWKWRIGVIIAFIGFMRVIVIHFSKP